MYFLLIYWDVLLQFLCYCHWRLLVRGPCRIHFIFRYLIHQSCMRIWWNPVHVGSSTFTLVEFRFYQTHLMGSGLLQPLLYPVSGVATPPRWRSLASQQPMGQCSCFVLLSQQPMGQCSCLVLLLRHNQWNNAVELNLFLRHHQYKWCCRL